MKENNLFSEKASATNVALVCLVLSIIPFVFAYLCLMAHFGLDAWSFGFPLLIIGGLMVFLASIFHYDICFHRILLHKRETKKKA